MHIFFRFLLLISALLFITSCQDESDTTYLGKSIEQYEDKDLYEAIDANDLLKTKWLFENGLFYSNNRCKDHLFEAYLMKREKMVQLLESHGARTNAIYKAILFDDVKEVRRLIESGKNSNVTMPLANIKLTPLYLSAMLGKKEIFEYLKQHSAYDPIVLGSYLDDPKYMKEELEKNKQLYESADFSKAYYVALKLQHYEAKLFLEQFNFSKNYYPKICNYSDEYKQIKYYAENSMLEYFNQIKGRCMNSCCSLPKAAAYGETKMVEKLIEWGVPIDCNYEGTALSESVDKQNKLTFNKILASAQEIKSYFTFENISNESTPYQNYFLTKLLETANYKDEKVKLAILLRLAKEDQALDLIKELLQNGESIAWVLRDAISFSDEKVVDYLLKQNVIDNNNKSNYVNALSHACKYGNINIIRDLIENGYAIEHYTLKMALENKQYGVIEYLMNQGANPFEKVSDLPTAYEMAEQMRDLEALRLFKEQTSTLITIKWLIVILLLTLAIVAFVQSYLFKNSSAHIAIQFRSVAFFMIVIDALIAIQVEYDIYLWRKYVESVLIYLYMITLAHFTLHNLSINKESKIYKGFNSIALALSVLLLSLSINELFFTLQHALMVLFTIGIAILYWYKSLHLNHKEHYFFSIFALIFATYYYGGYYEWNTLVIFVGVSIYWFVSTLNQLAMHQLSIQQKLITYQNNRDKKRSNELLREIYGRNQELHLAIKEKAVLLRELNHRIKNNIQMILSIYRLKLSNVLDEKQKERLYEAEEMIVAMARIHELLYKQDDVAQVDFNYYTIQLFEEIKRAYSSFDVSFDISAKANISVEESITLGIIMNELITNSFKHAFKDKKGKISINVMQNAKQIELAYSDSGEGYEWKRSNGSFGMRFIESIVKLQLKGKLYHEKMRTNISYNAREDQYVE